MYKITGGDFVNEFGKPWSKIKFRFFFQISEKGAILLMSLGNPDIDIIILQVFSMTILKRAKRN